MHQTPWTKKASSLPSDRIKPASQPAPKNLKGKGGKGTNTPPEPQPPKSKAVQQLEALRNGLTTSSGGARDPKGGCFCQARAHPLSPHTTLCRACGLVLCALNLPQYACPHCGDPLLGAPARDALIARLETQITEALAREAQLRARAAEEARRSVGAFPTLGATTTSSSHPSAASAAPQTRTVLSLNSKTKKVTVSSFSTPVPSPGPSRPASRAASPEPVRVAKPPAEVVFVPASRQDPLRPWKDLGDDAGGATYVAAPSLDAEGEGAGKKRRRNRGKAKEKENNGGGPAENSGGGSTPTILD
ncbi:hypothetical protein C8J57DRAFT_1067631 [Mycena rebaudengoi]|nr:hypothetical protein C8J57DRAFT_1067631 [Mycena rebaudengoi]